MAITASQKKALESAGYTVSGSTIKNKSGGSVGGINKNGNLWSSSSKVKSIMGGGKSEATKGETKAKEKPKAKVASKAKSAPKTTSPRPKAKPKAKGKVESKGTPLKTLKETISKGLDKADKEKKKTPAKATLIPAVGAAAKKVVASKPRGKPHNPAYKGRTPSKAGFQGRYATEVSRTGGRGARKLGYAPTLRVGGGAGRVSLDDKLANRKLQ